MSVVINIRTSEYLLNEIDNLVKKGIFRNRTEALNEAMRLIIKRYKMLMAAENIKELEGKDLKKDLTALIEEIREGEERYE